MKKFDRVARAFLVVPFVALVLSCAEEGQRNAVEGIPNPKVTGGYVSDPDQILFEATIVQLNQKLKALDGSGKAQVAVVLLNSIGDQVPKDFAVELFNFWNIGSKEKDNGLLIVVVKDQHRVEFETGYGLEADLPDITCFKIQQNYILPYFAREDYDGGMLEGVDALVSHFQSGALPSNRIEPDEAQFDQAVQSATNGNFNESFNSPKNFSYANILAVIANSVAFLIFNTVVAFIAAFFSFGNDRYRYNPKEPRQSLFSNLLFFSKGLVVCVLAFTPLLIISLYLLFYKSIDAPGYVSCASGYVAWCFYVHLHYMILIPLKASRLKDRHSKHEALAHACRHLRIFTFIFPLPFLRLFYLHHQRKLQALRYAPFLCECSAEMELLNEIQDNEFISAGDLGEEELKSADYDVWVCRKCDRHRSFRYDNLKSKALVCKSCTKKTVTLERSDEVVAATNDSDGYGYNLYRCLHCNDESKIRFVIPKRSSSSSSSGSDNDSSFSSASDSDSWGGGSSGGGGAGSSW